MPHEARSIYHTHFRTVLALLSLSLLVLVPTSASLAQGSRGVVLVPGTVSLEDGITKAVLAALNAGSSLFPGTTYFAVTDWRQDGNWAVASVIGLSQLRNGGTWSVDDGNWLGLVLLHRSQAGAWYGATQGTQAFSALMAASPDAFLAPPAKRSLDPLLSDAAQAQDASSYIFPLQPGTLINYGSLGVHANGFSSVVSGWKAVDMMSDGDTSLNHAPNRLIASATGTISWICKGNVNVAVLMGDFFYTHLVYNANLVIGHTFNQGEMMGTLKTGNFNEACGYATQPSNWFHVHWGFPNADLHIEDWTLSMSTGNWTNGTSTVRPGQWLLAGPTPPMPANLIETSATQNAVNFAWNASAGAEGYHLYSWDSAASVYALQDTLPAAQTTYMEMRSACGWNQQYQVTAYNYIGDSPRASLQAFTIPCDPLPSSPANESSHRWNYDVTFQSSPAQGATGYLVEYWADPSLRLTCGWSGTASCHAGLLAPGQTYSWHVKARSAAGATGWSPTWTFTIQPLPCFTLTVAHTGTGSDPVPSPSHSAGCTAGQYHPTDMIDFVSTPNTGWTVGSWSGTDNDASTSTSNTLTMPDGDSTAVVNYTPIVPAVPVLISPANGAAKQPINIALAWNPASGAISYDYCLDTSTTCGAWVTTGSDRSVSISNLAYGTLYYWWVRATNVYGNSSFSARWSFTTGSKPGPFAKSSPANGAAAQPASTLLQWANSSDAEEYQYCIDTTDDGVCGGDNWTSTGAARSASLTGKLSMLTTYYWQVRAINGFGIRYADGGWWGFTTSGLPVAFTKRAPANLAVNVPVQPALSWSPSLYATGYEYCVDQTNDNVCDGGSWVRIGAATSFTLSTVLQPLTTYYWQVHALNGFGTATSNNDAWWSFTTGNLPAAFGKVGPPNAARNQRLRVTLSWQASAGATAYQYCVSKIRENCNSWTGAGTGGSGVAGGLSPHTTYYWQVRAINTIGATVSDGGNWWSFTTGYLPAAFSKISPPDDITNVALSPTLQWQASTYATTYDYCLATTDSCTAWINVGNATSVAVTGLKAGTLYYWQVRARNRIGTTKATGGLWSFRLGTVPAQFGKASPSNGALNQPAALTLAWNASSGATSYQYCIDTTNNNTCQNTRWVSVGANRTVNLGSLGLAPNTTYYWQVRAVNSFGTRLANQGIWWGFTTQP